MYSSPSMNLFYLEIGIISIGSSNSSYGIFMPTSRFIDFTEEQFAIFIFQCLVSIFDTSSLYSIKAKVLRVHLQLKSPKSEHQNSSYVQNNFDYSTIKTDAGIGLHMPPL